MAYAQAVDTDTSVWRNGEAFTVQQDGHEALLRILVHFGADKAIPSNVGYSGTGNGQIDFIDCAVGGVSETWTITLTGASNFTVSGSVTGAIAAGVVGTSYDEDEVKFKIVAGATPFVSSDAFTFDQTANTIPAADVWILDFWNPFDLEDNDPGGSLWWHGEGDGTEAIYCGIQIETGGANEWFWKTAYATGHLPSADWDAQPGMSPIRYTSLWDNDMIYWLVLNSRRYALAMEVSTTFHALYMGFFLPFGPPSEYPYPICNLGEHVSGLAFDSPSTLLNCFPFAVNSGHVRDLDGINIPVTNTTAGYPYMACHPNSNQIKSMLSAWQKTRSFDNGDHQLFPITLIKVLSSVASNPRGSLVSYGVFQGVRMITGTGNTAKTIINISGVDHVVFQNISRLTTEMFWTLEMA